MTKYERCSNCLKSKFSRKPGILERLVLKIPLGINPLIHCPDAVDGVITSSEYDQICNLGCGSFADNAPGAQT